jgi:hypothetical protein
MGLERPPRGQSRLRHIFLLMGASCRSKSSRPSWKRSTRAKSASSARIMASPKPSHRGDRAGGKTRVLCQILPAVWREHHPRRGGGVSRGPMAAFMRGLTFPGGQQPVIRGDGVYLRYPRVADFVAWSKLRAESRAFLSPWEPSWATDELSKGAFRRRLAAIPEGSATGFRLCFSRLSAAGQCARGRMHALQRPAWRHAMLRARLLGWRSDSRGRVICSMPFVP